MKKYLMLATASLSVMWGSSVLASVIVTLDSVVPNGPNWDWVYRADLQPDETLRTNDFFGVFDVQTFLGGDFGANDPSKQGLFTVSHQPLGTPGNPSQVDSETSAENFLVQYTGADIVPNPNTPAITLGDLIIRTNTNSRAPSFFLGQSAKTVGGALVLNGGPIDVAAVPEPGSLLLTIIGLIGVGAVGYRRRILGT